jgi:hypothetical protein
MQDPRSRPRLGARRVVRVCWRPAFAAALAWTLAGCGSAAHVVAATEGPQTSCQATVVEDLAHVMQRVYGEGVFSERTKVAKRFVARSQALSRAVATNDAAAAQAAAQELVATGKLTNLRVIHHGMLLADAGGPAITPLKGSIMPPGANANTLPIGEFATSVWSDEGFLAESEGITGGKVALRAHGKSIGGSFPLRRGTLPDRGAITIGGVHYEFASFPGKAFPSGDVRIYLFRTVPSTAEVCAPTREATTYKTISRLARLIYQAEAGHRTQPQIERVQQNTALLEAVSHNDPVGTRKAVEALLHHHIVRLRVYGTKGLLVDDGGPYVLAPVTAPLTLNGQTIGHFVLSIQDDEGYLRLTRRLAGLRVLMYMGNGKPGKGTLVKNSLGPEPGTVPERGRYLYRGETFQVYTVHAHAFPSGPLTINVLIPVPYR